MIPALLRAIAATLPAGVRERYREEWLADAHEAVANDIAPASLLTGALGVAFSIDRDDPGVAGVDAPRLSARRLRIATAAGASSVLLVAGSFLSGAVGVIATVTLVLAVVAGMWALAALAGAIRVSRAGRARRSVIAAVTLAAASILLLFAVMPYLAVLALVTVLPVIVLLLVLLDPRPQAEPVSRPVALVLVALSGLIVLAVVAASVLHVLVWNPLAKVPGLSLAQIYAQLDAAGEGSYAGSAVLIGALWIAGVVAALVLAALPVARVRRMMTARRILGAGLVAVGVAGIGTFVLGFGMGMSIADAFVTDGGDASPAGRVLTMVGVAALIAATFVGLLPSRIRPQAA